MSFGYLLPAKEIAGIRIAWSIFALHAVLQNSGDRTQPGEWRADGLSSTLSRSGLVRTADLQRQYSTAAERGSAHSDGTSVLVLHTRSSSAMRRAAFSVSKR